MSVDLSKVQWYQRSRGSIVAGPSVAINKGGRTIINEQAMDLVGNPEAMQVGILQGGRGKTTLVLKAAAKGESGALVVGRQGKKYALNTARFLKEMGLENHFGKMENTPELDEQNDTLFVTL